MRPDFHQLESTVELVAASRGAEAGGMSDRRATMVEPPRNRTFNPHPATVRPRRVAWPVARVRSWPPPKRS